MVRTLLDRLFFKQGEPEDIWTHVTPVLKASQEIVAAYRVLPPLGAATPRPTIVDRSEGRIVWQVPIGGSALAHMRVDRTNHLNEDRIVVIVKAVEFYAIWRAVEMTKGSESTQRPPPLMEIPMDRKWEWQAVCWEHGLSNPVPLADVSYHEENGIGFVDGITRTLWLLHRRAPSFPVLVHGRKAAKGLHELVGDQKTPIASVAELLEHP